MPKHYFPKFLQEGPLFNFDHYFLVLRKKMNYPLLDKFAQFIGLYDEKYILMLITYGTIFYFLENKYDIFQFAILVTLSDQMCKRLIKDRFKRRRPYKYVKNLEGQDHVFSNFSGYTRRAKSSMCSSHAANFLAQAILVNQLAPILSPIIFPLYIIIGIARWYIGAHWVTDILVGWVMGILAYFIHENYLYPYILTFWG